MSEVVPPTIHIFDYEFLTGTWSGPPGGAAWNVVFSYCRNNGLGGYNDPTEAGVKAINAFERLHKL